MAAGTYILTSELYYPIINYYQNIPTYFCVFTEPMLADEDCEMQFKVPETDLQLRWSRQGFTFLFYVSVVCATKTHKPLKKMDTTEATDYFDPHRPAINIQISLNRF